ncbi:MAG: hypothetical protein KDA20_08505 [Phycisphaerales bacterium]|nr:hypothetical protein [Phycisphaerales bacterium]
MCTTGCRPCCPLVESANPAVTDVDVKTANALRAALLDEQRAQAFYNNVLAVHGQHRPFVNIVRAEARHERLVATLMEQYGVEAPETAIRELPPVPATFAGCCTLAADLERDNIVMYDRLLQDVQQADIRAALERLRAASLNNHLPAFERWAQLQPSQSDRPNRQRNGRRRGRA